MSDKTFVPEGQQQPASQIGATLEALMSIIESRREAGDESYTHRLLSGKPDELLKKVMEEAGEVALAGKDADGLIRAHFAHSKMQGVPEGKVSRLERDKEAALDHLRYEAADVIYHLLVVLARYGIGIDELAAELNTRMTDEERPKGAVRIVDEHVNRG